MKMHAARGRLVRNRLRMQLDRDWIADAAGRFDRLVFAERDFRLRYGNSVRAQNLFRFSFGEQRATPRASSLYNPVRGQPRIGRNAAALLDGGRRLVQSL